MILLSQLTRVGSDSRKGEGSEKAKGRGDVSRAVRRNPLNWLLACPIGGGLYFPDGAGDLLNTLKPRKRLTMVPTDGLRVPKMPSFSS